MGGHAVARDAANGVGGADEGRGGRLIKTKRTTYEDIVNYVRRRWGLSIATCSVAHVNEPNGLNIRRAPRGEFDGALLLESQPQ